MNKTILIIFTGLVILVAGTYLWVGTDRPVSDELDFVGLLGDDSAEWDSVDLYFSDLGAAEIPEIDLADSLNVEAPDLGFSGLDLEGLGEVGIPEISQDLSVFEASFPELDLGGFEMGDDAGQQHSPAQWTPNSADCAPFTAAPDCSFVPEANRDMCQACREAGY